MTSPRHSDEVIPVSGLAEAKAVYTSRVTDVYTRRQALIRRLPTAGVEDILSWEPCGRWPRERIQKEFKALLDWPAIGLFSAPDRLNAMQFAWAAMAFRSNALESNYADLNYDKSESCRWAACHLLPDVEGFGKALKAFVVKRWSPGFGAPKSGYGMWVWMPAKDLLDIFEMWLDEETI